MSITAKTKVAIIKDYTTTDATLREVGDKYGISHETVRRVLDGRKKVSKGKRIVPVIKKEPIVTLLTGADFNSNSRWSIEDDICLRDYLYEGKTVKELSQILGRTYAAIYTRKWNLINSEFINWDWRFNPPVGIDRKESTRGRSEKDQAFKKMFGEGNLTINGSEQTPISKRIEEHHTHHTHQNQYRKD